MFRYFFSDELCNSLFNKWRPTVKQKKVKVIGILQLYNVLAVIVAAANIQNKSQEPTARKSSEVCSYVQTLRKQLSMEYRLSHEMPTERPTKGAKSINDGGNYVTVD